MTTSFEMEYAAAKAVDAQIKRERESGLWSGAPLFALGQYRCVLMEAFRAGARHGRAVATRDYMRDLHDEIAARDSWHRLAVELSREVESKQDRPTATVATLEAAGERRL